LYFIRILSGYNRNCKHDAAKSCTYFQDWRSDKFVF
jgi:hypothetical protein